MGSTFDTARIMDSIDMPSKIHVQTERTGDAIFAPIPTGPDIVIGRAVDHREYPPVQYLVVATQLDRPWPGTDRTVTFAVQRLALSPGGRYESVESWGFFEETDCYLFLTGKKSHRYVVWNLRGDTELTEPRRGRGLPDAAIDRMPEKVWTNWQPPFRYLVCGTCGAENISNEPDCQECAAEKADSPHDQ